MNKKTLVLGIGNPILGDDGIGIHIVRSLQTSLDSKEITFDEASASGLELAERLQGFQKAVLIDSMRTHQGRIGDIHRLTYENMPALFGSSPHDLDLRTAVEFMKQSTSMPKDIKIYGIETAETNTYTTEITPKVKEAADKLIKEIKEALR